jgi:hypothetical protein
LADGKLAAARLALFNAPLLKAVITLEATCSPWLTRSRLKARLPAPASELFVERMTATAPTSRITRTIRQNNNTTPRSRE